MLDILKPRRSCTQLGELIADGLDAGFVSLLAEFQKNADNLTTTPEKLTEEVAYLEAFIAERAVNRMIRDPGFQVAILSALPRRLVRLSGILPDGQAFQDGYDERWDTYDLYWREPLNASASMALVSQAMSLAGMPYHYGVTSYLVEHTINGQLELLRMLSDYKKQFRLTL